MDSRFEFVLRCNGGDDTVKMLRAMTTCHWPRWCTDAVDERKLARKIEPAIIGLLDPDKVCDAVVSSHRRAINVTRAPVTSGRSPAVSPSIVP